MYCTNCGQLLQSEARFCQQCGGPVAGQTGQQTAGPPRLTFDAPPHIRRRLGTTRQGENAGFWLRLIAHVVDNVIVFVIALALLFAAAYLAGKAGATSATNWESAGKAMAVLVSWTYFTFLESSSWQATPGKMLFQIRVTDSLGNTISFGRANGRFWAKLLSYASILIGFLMAAFTQDKQALHDIIAGTFVVKSTRSS